MTRWPMHKGALSAALAITCGAAAAQGQAADSARMVVVPAGAPRDAASAPVIFPDEAERRKSQGFGLASNGTRFGEKSGHQWEGEAPAEPRFPGIVPMPNTQGLTVQQTVRPFCIQGNVCIEHVGITLLLRVY